MGAIKGIFETRREADMAVEHFVQQMGIERTSIFVEPEGSANSVGTEVAGADAKREEPSPEPSGDEAALNGRIVVSLDSDDAGAGEIEAVFREFKAAEVTG